MPEIVPSVEQMTMLVGKPLYEIWTQLCALIDEKYDMERLWGSGGKAWTYEYKYRRGGKTLCALRALCQRKLHRVYGHLRQGRPLKI